jgi:hypothetical protein
MIKFTVSNYDYSNWKLISMFELLFKGQNTWSLTSKVFILVRNFRKSPETGFLGHLRQMLIPFKKISVQFEF